MSGHLIDAARTVGSKVDLSTPFALAKDLGNCREVFVRLGPKRERLRLIYRVNAMLDPTQAIKNLLITVYIEWRFAHLRAFFAADLLGFFAA
jgi:hypothetical protein